MAFLLINTIRADETKLPLNTPPRSSPLFYTEVNTRCSGYGGMIVILFVPLYLTHGPPAPPVLPKMAELYCALWLGVAALFMKSTGSFSIHPLPGTA